MTHKIIIFAIVALFLLAALFQLIKNKPQYLVLLGIRGFFSVILIHVINYLCEISKLSTLIQVNPLTVAGGAFLGMPGILLLYVSKIYLL